MNINGYLNSEKIEDEDTRNDFIEFVAVIEDMPKEKVFSLERDSDYWNEMRDDFFEI